MKKILSAVIATLVTMSFTTIGFATDTDKPIIIANPAIDSSPAIDTKNGAHSAKSESNKLQEKERTESRKAEAKVKAEAKNAKAKEEADAKAEKELEPLTK